MAKKSPSERFGKVRKTKSISSETFGTLPYVSERTAEHVLSVRAVAKMFENAGVARTERSIINWCHPNPQGIPRLDCFFDTNEHKYFITPLSVDRAISEERNKLKIQGQTTHSATTRHPAENSSSDSETFGKQAEAFGILPKGAETFGNATPNRHGRELEVQIRDLQITNKAKDMYIERLEKSGDKLFEDLKHASQQLGELKSQIRQLEAPREPSDMPGEPKSSEADAPAQATAPVQVVTPEHGSAAASSQAREEKPQEPLHPIAVEASDYQEHTGQRSQEREDATGKL